MKDAIQYFLDFLHHFCEEEYINIEYVPKIFGDGKRKFIHGKYLASKDIFEIQLLEKYKGLFEEIWILCHELGHHMLYKDHIKIEDLIVEEEICDSYFIEFLKNMPLHIQEALKPKLFDFRYLT